MARPKKLSWTEPQQNGANPPAAQPVMPAQPVQPGYPVNYPAPAPGYPQPVARPIPVAAPVTRILIAPAARRGR